MRWVQTILIGLVFAVTGVAADKKPPTEEQLTEWFNQLNGQTDGQFLRDWDTPDYVLRAVFGFLDHPNEGVPFLRKKLKPTNGPEAKTIDGWIKDYLSDDAKVRDAADEQLRKHRDDYLVLQKLLNAGRETDSQLLRRRLVAVIQNEKVTEPKEGDPLPLPIEFVPSGAIEIRRVLNAGKRSGSPQARYIAVDADAYAPFRTDLLRARRAFLVLERIGTADAVEVLKEVAGGRAELPATIAAKEALERLKAK